MCVAGIGISTHRSEVDRDMPRRVRAVHHREQAQLARPRAQLGDRQDRARRRGDMADREHARRLSDVIPEQLERRPHDPRSGRVPGEVDGTVLQVGRQHLVLRREPEGAGDHVHPGGRVRDEHEVVAARPEVVAQLRAHLRDQSVPAARQKLDRLALEFALPLLVLLEHRPRARAERAMVEEDDVRIEQELVSQVHRRTVAASRVESGCHVRDRRAAQYRCPACPASSGRARARASRS